MLREFNKIKRQSLSELRHGSIKCIGLVKRHTKTNKNDFYIGYNTPIKEKTLLTECMVWSHKITNSERSIHHFWITDKELYTIPIGELVQFDAQVSVYRKISGKLAFTLINISNIKILEKEKVQIERRKFGQVKYKLQKPKIKRIEIKKNTYIEDLTNMSNFEDLEAYYKNLVFICKCKAQMNLVFFQLQNNTKSRSFWRCSKCRREQNLITRGKNE